MAVEAGGQAVARPPVAQRTPGLARPDPLPLFRILRPAAGAQARETAIPIVAAAVMKTSDPRERPEWLIISFQPK